jgi:hypothetical protein
MARAGRHGAIAAASIVGSRGKELNAEGKAI